MLAGAVGGVLGSASDPAVTKSYVDEVFVPGVRDKAGAAIDLAIEEGAGAEIDALFARIQALALPSDTDASTLAREASRQLVFRAGGFLSLTLEMGETLQGGDGTMFVVRAGNMQSGGEITDLTQGMALSAGNLVPRGAALFAADGGSLTARTRCEVLVKGYFRYILPPGNVAAERAQALQTMGLLAGTAAGMELSRPVTRAEGITVMLRLFGEGDTALAFTGTHPFADVPAGNWAYPFVAYANSKAYTAGTGPATFSPELALSGDMFITYVLVALGYSSSTDFSWDKSMEFAVSIGLITQADMAKARDLFTRDQMVYFAYSALNAKYKNTDDTLLRRLVALGIIDAAAAETAMGET
jgi:hypothetical protein